MVCLASLILLWSLAFRTSLVEGFWSVPQLEHSRLKNHNDVLPALPEGSRDLAKVNIAAFAFNDVYSRLSSELLSALQGDAFPVKVRPSSCAAVQLRFMRTTKPQKRWDNPSRDWISTRPRHRAQGKLRRCGCTVNLENTITAKC